MPHVTVRPAVVVPDNLIRRSKAFSRRHILRTLRLSRRLAPPRPSSACRATREPRAVLLEAISGGRSVRGQACLELP